MTAVRGNPCCSVEAESQPVKPKLPLRPKAEDQRLSPVDGNKSSYLMDRWNDLFGVMMKIL